MSDKNQAHFCERT